jgi:hypothetical protein
LGPPKLDIEKEQAKILAALEKSDKELAEESEAMQGLLKRIVIIDLKMLDQEEPVSVKARRLLDPQLSELRSMARKISPDLTDMEKAWTVQLSEEQLAQFGEVMDRCILLATGHTAETMPLSEALKRTLFMKILELSQVSDSQLEDIRKFRPKP